MGLFSFWRKSPSPGPPPATPPTRDDTRDRLVEAARKHPTNHGDTTRIALLTRYEKMENDLVAAAELQKSLLPAGLPELPAYDFAVHYQGSWGVSGDHYDFIRHADGRMAIVIADASGKGVSGALVMALTKALLACRPSIARTPDAILSFLNEKLYGLLRRGNFVSMSYALLDPKTDVLQIANAGHMPALVWREKDGFVRQHPAHGIVLGAGPPALFDPKIANLEVRLAPGDRVLMVTDGVTEAMAPGQREFGVEMLIRRLKAGARQKCAELVADIAKQIEIHRGGGEQSDDITILAFQKE